MADKMPKDTSLQSTKQMLDELDSLMERMLSLPVNELDGLSNLQEPTKGPSVADSLTLLVTSEPAAKTVELAVDQQSLPPTPKKPIERRPRAKLPHLPLQPPHLKKSSEKADALPDGTSTATATEAPPATEPVPLSNEVEPPSMLRNLEPLLAQAPESSPASPSAAVPILWLNQTFDRWTMSLGGIGKWLRSAAGRAMVGYVGILMITIAAGWVLKDWLGWN